MLWTYNARAVHVVDGDTIDLDVDLGFGVRKLDRFRLVGIDTPELNSTNVAERERAARAKERLESLVAGQPLIAHTVKDKREKYGRYLVDLLLPDNRSVSNILGEEGLAVAYTGGAR